MVGVVKAFNDSSGGSNYADDRLHDLLAVILPSGSFDGADQGSDNCPNKQ